jgi:hypothetical protein
MPAVKSLIRDFVTHSVSKAIEEFELASAVKHQGLKGKAREIFVQRVFRPLLSNDFGLGSGTITDRYDNQSGETDVVLYCPEIMPPIDAKEAAGYFAIEGCIYAFEVKSVVTANEIKDAITKGQKLDTLDSIYVTNDGPISTRPITVLFGFSSDLISGPDHEFKRFRNLIDAAGLNRFGVPPIRVSCVLGKGYWYFGERDVNGQKEGRWFRSGSGGKHPEFVALVAGVLNTIKGTSKNSSRQVATNLTR